MAKPDAMKPLSIKVTPNQFDFMQKHQEINWSAYIRGKIQDLMEGKDSCLKIIKP